MFKKIMLTICLMFSFILFGSSFDSMAAGDVFYLDYAEPATSEAQGYLVLAMQNNSNSSVGIMTFFWNTYAQTNAGYSSPAEMYITASSSSVTFNVNQYGADGAWYSLNGINMAGDYRSYSQSNSSTYTYNASSSGYSIVGWKLGGNGYVTGMQSNYDFAVFFSDDGNAILLQQLVDLLTMMSYDNDTIISKLTTIVNNTDDVETKLQSLINLLDDAVDELESIDTTTTSMLSWLKEIYNSLVTVRENIKTYYPNFNTHLLSLEAKLGTLIDEQRMSNTWLEKIYNFMKEKDEKDKQAATQQGNQSSANVQSSLKDKSEGFNDSLGGLTSSMSYSGTECSWTFPTMKLPAIPGVMDEVTLVESQEIDFTVWINSIPSGILLLIQSVCTAALIIFCFKELYGTVEYALTLRKGGGD